MTRDRVIEIAVALCALVAGLVLLAGITDVHRRAAPSLVTVPPPPASVERDSALTVAVTHAGAR